VVQLADAFGERCRARLQDVRRLDLVDVTVANRGHVGPSLALCDPLPADRLAAPRRDDHIRLTANNVLRTDDALLAEFGVAEFGEDRIAAGDLHELFDPANAEISGSSHSSKKTRGRHGSCAGGGANRIDLELEM
jgi:hypothetical protein